VGADEFPQNLSGSAELLARIEGIAPPLAEEQNDAIPNGAFRFSDIESVRRAGRAAEATNWWVDVNTRHEIAFAHLDDLLT